MREKFEKSTPIIAILVISTSRMIVCFLQYLDLSLGPLRPGEAPLGHVLRLGDHLGGALPGAQGGSPATVQLLIDLTSTKCRSYQPGISRLLPVIHH